MARERERESYREIKKGRVDGGGGGGGWGESESETGKMRAEARWIHPYN